VISLAALLIAAPVHVVVDVSGVHAPASTTPTAKTPPPADAVSEAKKLYTTRCALCHGATGQGDGPSAMGLPVRPRRHSDAVWQASVSDDDITAVILDGGAAKKLSILMPANPDLKAKPDVLRALVDVIRGLRAPNGTARVTVLGGAKPISASADADAKGNAKVDVAAAPGKVQLVVEDSAGVLCKLDVTLTADFHTTCGAKP
jgi:high-affinity iron transporter